MSSTKSATSTQPEGDALADLRRRAAESAMWKLKYEVLPRLESVIMGTPSGEVRDQLTQANIILQKLVAE